MRYSGVLSLAVAGTMVLLGAAPESATAAAVSEPVLQPHELQAHSNGIRRATEFNSMCNGAPTAANYAHDESTNEAGPNQCYSGCDCDGLRGCSTTVGSTDPGWCIAPPEPIQIRSAPAQQHSSGIRRATVYDNTCNGAPKPADYRHDESTNSGGPNRCETGCDCDGQRGCSKTRGSNDAGWCQ